MRILSILNLARFCFKIMIPELQIREIPNPEKPTGDPPALMFQLIVNKDEHNIYIFIVQLHFQAKCKHNSK